jgi:hypothetical protein
VHDQHAHREPEQVRPDVGEVAVQQRQLAPARERVASVERKVRADREPEPDHRAQARVEVQQLFRSDHRGEIHEHAEQPDHAKARELREARVAKRVQLGDVQRVLREHPQALLALAELAIFEHDRDLGDAHRRGLHRDLEHDLPANGVERQTGQQRLAHRHEAGRRVGHAGQAEGHQRSQLRLELREQRPVVRPAARHMPAADHDVGLVLCDQLDHPRQRGGGMAAIGIHDDADRRGGRLEAAQHRGREAPLFGAADAAHRVVARERLGDVGGAIRRVVVDDDDLALHAARTQALRDARHDHGQRGRLVERGQDDRDRRCVRLHRGRASYTHPLGTHAARGDALTSPAEP